MPLQTADETLDMPQVRAHIANGALGKVVVALAKYSYFVTDTMKRSTVHGGRGNMVALDRHMLAMLKDTVRRVCMGTSETEFEFKWQKCLSALGSACRHLRKKEK